MTMGRCFKEKQLLLAVVYRYSGNGGIIWNGIERGQKIRQHREVQGVNFSFQFTKKGEDDVSCVNVKNRGMTKIGSKRKLIAATVPTLIYERIFPLYLQLISGLFK